MIFRQLFDSATWTYTYLLADPVTREAVFIDPVLEQMSLYSQLINELALQVRFAIDTHVHADHVTALGALRERYSCETVHGVNSKADCVSKYVFDGEVLTFGSISLMALSTPGHTDDSFCFYTESGAEPMLFTGDTLLIRGTGRTDFQNGDAGQQYDSIVDKLFTFPDETAIYPGHDYRGMSKSTIAEEKAHNPRLQVEDKDAYIALMASLDLPNPRLMDIAVPANLACGMQN